MRLAWLMEEVHDDWNAEKNEPQFKAEYPIHYAQKNTLREAATAAADRLKMNEVGTATLRMPRSGRPRIRYYRSE